MHLVCTCTFSLSFIIDCYSVLLQWAASLMGQCALLVAIHWTISIKFIVFLSHCMVENKLSLYLPRGPLAVLKENWCGLRDAPLNMGQSTAEYLNDLRTNLEVATSYATEHGKREQQRYVSRYNLHSRVKKFGAGDQVLILIPDTTSSNVFSRWQGPATVVEIRPHNSYLVELHWARRHLHADKLHKYEISVGEVIVTPADCNDLIAEMSANQCAVVYEND